MAEMKVPVSFIGSGIVVLPLKEYKALVKERDYAFEQFHENELDALGTVVLDEDGGGEA